MKHLTLPLTLMLVAALAVACSDDASIPTAADHELAASTPAASAKPGSGSGDANSRTVVTFVDGPSMKMTSDGGVNYGPVYYEGGKESVHANVLYYDSSTRSGSFIFDPDKNRSTAVRKVSITFTEQAVSNPNGAPEPVAGTHKVGPYFDLRAIMQVTESNGTPEAGTPDEWIAAAYPDSPIRLLRENPAINTNMPNDGTYANPDFRLKLSSTGIANCETILFDRVQITRTLGDFNEVSLTKWNIDTRGQWVVESLPDENGNHRALCQYTSSRKLVDGAVFSIPFKMTVDERR